MPGERALLGGPPGAVPVRCFSKENGLPALLPAVPPAVRFLPALLPALFPALLEVLGFLSPVAGNQDCNTRPLATSVRLYHPNHCLKSYPKTNFGIVQKVFSEKASAIARIRQKCVRNASKMRQNGSSFVGKEERPKWSASDSVLSTNGTKNCDVDCEPQGLFWKKIEIAPKSPKPPIFANPNCRCKNSFHCKS